MKDEGYLGRIEEAPGGHQSTNHSQPSKKSLDSLPKIISDAFDWIDH